MRKPIDWSLVLSERVRVCNAITCKGGGGGGTTTSVVNVPPPSQAETELQAINLRTAQRGEIQNLQQYALTDPEAALAYLDKPSASGAFSGLESFDTPEFRSQLQSALGEKKTNDQFNALLQKQLTARLTGTAQLTEGEQTMLDTLYEQAASAGGASLTQYGREIAAQRGLRTSDSPIGNELIRERGSLELGLRAAKASSSLDLGAAAKTFDEQVRQFQQGLRQQAFNNRLSLSTAAPLSFNAANALAAQRFSGAGTTTSATNNLGFGQVASGVGGGLVGLGLGLQSMRS